MIRGIRKALYTGFLIVLSGIFFEITLVGQISFSYKSEYSYLKGKDASALPAGWMNPGFDCSGWSKGAAPFRYGDGSFGVELTDMMNSYSTVYLITTFECDNKDLVNEITFTADYDDGFIIWVNGQEVLSRNSPSPPGPVSFAVSNHESGTGEAVTLQASSMILNEGTNLIAVQGFNVSLASSDFYFDLEIKAEKEIPEYPAGDSILFSVNSGFFYNQFDVELAASDPSASIIYTLDGSYPETSASAVTASSPVNIHADPESSAGRPVTPVFIVRASLFRPGYRPSLPETRNYVFIEKVKTQVYPGGGWPSGDINGQVVDLESDSRVVNDPEYASLVTPSLMDIPSISVVTDIKNLFDPATGIYVNADRHGVNWERECNIELMYPGGDPGFNINAGLRIRGGWSRHSDFPKHSFRLFFREEYGAAKLNFPLFGDEGAAFFDKIDLRTEQNYAWSTGNPFNSLVRDVFSRDTQGEMGQPYTRSRAYHLYLNGMYWGVYQTQERPEARFGSTYLGGDDEDYDVVKVNVENWSYTIETTDGNLDSWARLWEYCTKGFSSNADYFRLEGRDGNGKPVKGGEIMINVDNLIDYMLIIFYTGNFDAPTSSFMGNKGSNNFYAIDDRTDRSRGFTFYVHDAEHSLFEEQQWPGIGLYEDRVNIGSRGDEFRMEVNDFYNFHPQWLHHRLTANAEYRSRFADRAYLAFQPGGVLSPEQGLKRLNKRAEEVNLAVIAESMRWGDARRFGAEPFTRNRNWIPEINKIRERFLPFRSSIVVSQLRSAALYPEINAPVVSAGGSPIKGQICRLSSDIKISVKKSRSTGMIYYTLDGTDPRKTGGGIAEGVKFSSGEFSLDITGSAIISARVFDNGKWSALTRVSFIHTNKDYSGLKITEISYHPPDLVTGADTVPGTDLEFLEFKNSGTNSINLSGLRIDSAVHYSFPPDILIPPGKFFVVSSKDKEFYSFYGIQASGEFRGNLSNGGEELIVEDASGMVLFNFTYSDSSPWPEEADGDGFTLSSLENNPSGIPSNPYYWVKSSVAGGTPFADNNAANPPDPDLPGSINLLAYPNPSTGRVSLHLLTETDINILEVTVFDMYGHKIAGIKTGNPGMIDLSLLNLAGGLYIVECRSGGYVRRTKIFYFKQ